MSYSIQNIFNQVVNVFCTINGVLDSVILQANQVIEVDFVSDIIQNLASQGILSIPSNSTPPSNYFILYDSITYIIQQVATISFSSIPSGQSTASFTTWPVSPENPITYNEVNANPTQYWYNGGFISKLPVYMLPSPSGPVRSTSESVKQFNLIQDFGRDYGASGTPTMTTVNMTAGSKILEISPTNAPNPSFANGEHVYILWAGPVTTNMGTVAQGGTMSATAVGITGTTSRTFWISYICPNDGTISQAASVTCANGPANFNGTCYIQLTWGASLPYDQIGYMVWGDPGNPTDTQGFLGFVQAESFMWYGGIGNYSNTYGAADPNSFRQGTGQGFYAATWTPGDEWPQYAYDGYQANLCVPFNAPTTAPVPGPLVGATVVSGGGTNTLTLDTACISTVVNAPAISDDTPRFNSVYNNESYPGSVSLNIPVGFYTVQGTLSTSGLTMDMNHIEGNNATIIALPMNLTNQGLHLYEVYLIQWEVAYTKNLTFSGGVGFWGNAVPSVSPLCTFLQISNTCVFDTCRFTDGSAAMIQISGQNVTFKGCDFTAYLGPPVFITGINNHILFDNCKFTGFAQYAIWAYQSSGQITFRDCQISDGYGRYNGPTDTGYLIYTDGSIDILFENSSTATIPNALVLAQTLGGVNPAHIRFEKCRIGASASLLNLTNASDVTMDECDLTAFSNVDAAISKNASTVTLTRCLGYNPVGVMTAPALTSGVAYVNDNNVAVTAILQGGSVQEIALQVGIQTSAVNTGLTSGQFLLQPGDRLVPTFTTAPTFTVIGM